MAANTESRWGQNVGRGHVLILDTDVLTIIQRRCGMEYTRLVRRLNEAEDDVAVTIVNMDLKIASVALSHDALLITRNIHDFEKVPGLRVEDWTLEFRE